jgi:arylsulfatase A-like enzyme
VTSPDFYPTLLAAAGLPPRPEQHVDGVDFSPLLRGEPFTRGSIYWHYPHYSNQGGTPSAGLRDGDWKLIYQFETKRSELYNIRADIAEQHDLAATHPEVSARLERTLLAWLPTVGAQIPAPNPQVTAYPDLLG